MSIQVSASSLDTVKVTVIKDGSQYVAEGVVESVKVTEISSEMPGRITEVLVKAGDIVRLGQVLTKIDTRIANQQVVGSQAQTAAATAQLSVARQTYERKKRLFDHQYISQAGFEQAEAEFKTAEAQVRAQQSQIMIASVKSGMNTIKAPYSGIVASVSAEMGDMALPGKPLMTIYNPNTMRILASVPSEKLSKLEKGLSIQIEIPALSNAIIPVSSSNFTVLPTADSISHQRQVRISLPDNLKGLAPGMFARLKLSIDGDHETPRLFVPISSVMKRGELNLLYVVSNNKAQLRQVRLGSKQDDLIEVVSGVEANDQIVIHLSVAIDSNEHK
jgi:RND family efflux transporter MFP subunit